MRTLHIVFPSRATLDVTPRHLFLACALIAAACLLFQYVALLHESVERGMRLRDQPVVVAPSTRVSGALANAVMESGFDARVRAAGAGKAMR